MGYYGASMYRGDYYGQGDFYRGYSGDPGFFDFISDVGKGIVGVASKVLPYAAPIIGTALGGPVGGLIGGIAGKVLQPGPPIQTALTPMNFAPAYTATAPGTGSTAAMIPSIPSSFTGVSIGGARGVQIGKKTIMPGGTPTAHFAPGGGAALGRAGARTLHIAGVRHHRRMNPLNPHALGRALRRAKGFRKYATKVLKLCGDKRHVDGFKDHKRKR